VVLADAGGSVWAFEAGGRFRWRRRAEHPRSPPLSGDQTTFAPRGLLSAHAVAVSRQGTLVASGTSYGCVILWDARSGARRGVFPIEATHITDLAWGREGRLAIGTAGGLVLLCRVGE
jgi:WD40 repeat protein